MQYDCPEKHQSDSPEFCSVCGIEISQSPLEMPAASSAGPVAVAPDELCPDCETPRESPTQTYCEVCGFNYRTKASGVPNPVAASAGVTAEAGVEAPADDPAPEPLAGAVSSPKRLEEPSSSASVPSRVLSRGRWDVVVDVDPLLYSMKDADAPVDPPTRTFRLFEQESMIGRGGTDIRVQVPIVDDVGVSRRQALLVRQAGGGLILRDLGSTNGTQLNGADVVAGVDVPLKDGDRISVGAWTRITVRCNPA